MELTDEMDALLKAKGFKRKLGGLYWSRSRWWNPMTWGGGGDYLNIKSGIWYYSPPPGNPHTSTYGEGTGSLITFLRRL
jgi:hypothetical protein